MKRYYIALFSLKTTGRLMELNHSDGKLEVQYDENLVKLIREVRQFQGLGFNVPSKIQSTSTKAMKFYQQAIILKQVLYQLLLTILFLVTMLLSCFFIFVDINY